jgi:hypothetical protein
MGAFPRVFSIDGSQSNISQRIATQRIAVGANQAGGSDAVDFK